MYIRKDLEYSQIKVSSEVIMGVRETIWVQLCILEDTWRVIGNIYRGNNYIRPELKGIYWLKWLKQYVREQVRGSKISIAIDNKYVLNLHIYQ